MFECWGLDELRTEFARAKGTLAGGRLGCLSGVGVGRGCLAVGSGLVIAEGLAVER